MQTPKFLKIFTDKNVRDHFWYYYKGYVAFGAFILVLLIMTVVDVTKNSQPVFQVTYINAPSILEETWTQQFTDSQPFGEKRELTTESVIVSDEIGITELEASITHVFAQIVAGEIDIFVSEQDAFRQFTEGEFFDDLTTYMPEAFIETFSDSLYYSNVGGTQCATGIIWKQPSNQTTYVFAIPFSSELKESAATMIQLLFQKEAIQ